MYGDTDIYRIKDLINSLDRNHWKNKQWLADFFKRTYGDYNGGTFIVLGGWYGMMAYQLRKAFGDGGFDIISTDMDPKCRDIGYKLFYDQNIQFTTMRMEDLDRTDISGIICTSCEHVDRDILLDVVRNKSEDTWIAFQTASLEHPTHINPSTTLKDFVDPISELLRWPPHYTGTMDNPTFQRHMIIGK